MNAVINGGFPEPLGSHGIRLVDSSHDDCGHSTRVRLPSELGAQVVRRVVCEQCATPYDTTRVEDCGIEQELADLTAAVAPMPSAPPEPELQPEPTPLSAPEPFEPHVYEPPVEDASISESPSPFETPTEQDLSPFENTAPSEPADPSPFEHGMVPSPFENAAEPDVPAEPSPAPYEYAEPAEGAAPSPFESSAPIVDPAPPSPFETPSEPEPSPFETPSEPEPSPFETPADEAPSPFETPVQQDPSPFEHGMPAASEPAPTEVAPAPYEYAEPAEEAAPSPFESSAPIVDPTPAAPSPFESSAPIVDPAPPSPFETPSEPEPSPFEAAASPEPSPFETPADEAPSPFETPVQQDSPFTSRPLYDAPAGAEESPTSEAPPSAPPPGFAPAAPIPAPTAPSARPKRKTAVGPEIKLPSFKRKPKAEASAPPATASDQQVESAPAPAPAGPSAKPKRKTAIGPEIKLPSFRRKPKAAAPATPATPPAVAMPDSAPAGSASTPEAPAAPAAKPKRKTAIGPEIKLPSFKRKPKAAAPRAPEPTTAADLASPELPPDPAAKDPAPAAKPKRKTAIGPEIKLPSFKRKPKAVATPAPEATPPALDSAPTAPSSTPEAPATPAARPKRKTAIGPEIKLPSFKRKPKAGPSAPPTLPPDQHMEATPTPAAKPKRKTAIGPEIKLPSFKRKPKAAAPPAPEPTTASVADDQSSPALLSNLSPVFDHQVSPSPPSNLAPTSKPKRKTAIGPEIKLPSFKRKPVPMRAAPVRAEPPAQVVSRPTAIAFPVSPATDLGPLALADPSASSAFEPKRRTGFGPEVKMPSFKLSGASAPSLSGPTWRRLSVPLAGGAVIIGLLLLQGGGGDDAGDLGKFPTTSPASKTSQPTGSKGSGSASVNSKNAEVVAGSDYTLALPKGWKKISPPGGATFAALAADGSADASLWIKRDPNLDFATFEATSLDQLKQLGGSAKVIDRQQGPTVAESVVTLGTEAPEGAPDYQVVLRSSGPFFYYLATTVQPDASSDSISGVKLIQDSLLPTGSAG